MVDREQIVTGERRSRLSRREALRAMAIATGAGVVVWVTGGCASPAPTPTSQIVEKTVTPPPAVKWGYFTGGGLDTVTKLTEMVGKKPDYLTKFIGWANGGMIPQDIIDFARTHNQTILAFWEAFTPGKTAENDPAYSCPKILEGAHDSYLRSFAQQVQKAGVPIILFPFPEPNGNWTPQCAVINGNSPDLFRQAFCHVAGFFKDVPNAQVGLALNNRPTPAFDPDNQFTAYNAGSCIKVIGLDGFNFGPPQEKWQPFGSVFGEALAEVGKWGAPVMISSMSCAPGPERPQWITDALIDNRRSRRPFNWFGQNKKEQGGHERDWSLTTDPASLQAFKESLL